MVVIKKLIIFHLKSNAERILGDLSIINTWI